MADDPGGMETIGYLFTAKDLASGVATKAEKTVEAAAEGVENTLLGLTTSTEALSVQMSGSFEVIEGAVEGVQKAAEAVLVNLSTTFDEVPPKVSRAFQHLPKIVQDALAQIPIAEQAAAVRDFYGALDALPVVAESVARSLDKMEGALDQNQATLANLAKWTGKGIKDSVFGLLGAGAGLALSPIEKLAVGVGNAADGFQAFLKSDRKLKTVGGLFFDLKVKAGSAAVAIKDGVRAFFGFSDPKGMKGFKDFEHGLGGLHRSGGIGGALLGPLAPVMRLLSPLLDLVEEALQPAIETFGMLVRNAFAPFSFLADTIAQSLAPLIQKVIGPFASMMELIAAQVGTLLQGLMDTGATAGPMAKLSGFFAQMAGVLGDLATEVLPILMDVGGTLFDTLMEVLPDVLDVVVELAKALTPLLVGLVKIGAALVKYVFGPLLVTTIKTIAKWIKLAVPYIAEFALAFRIGAEKLVVKITDFFGHFSKNASDFYVLFIAPAIDWLVSLPEWVSGIFGSVADKVGGFFTTVGGMVVNGWAAFRMLASAGWDAVVALFDFTGVTGSIGSAFDTLLSALSAPLRALVSFVADWLVAPLNKLLSATLPVIGVQLGTLIGLPGAIAAPGIPGLAEGGIVNRPTFAQIGEAGPEAVIPLRTEAIEKIIAPMFPKLEMPGLREMVGLLSDINAALRGTLRVTGGDDVGSGGGGRGDDADLFAAPGLSGAGGW